MFLNGAYATRYRLVGGLIGSIGGNELADITMGCYRIGFTLPLKSSLNEVCFNLDFVEKNSFKGIDISYCLEKMYNMDFPEVRNNRGWSFTYSGMDMFGSFYVKDGEKQLKRFVTLFTCFSERVIHLESNVSMDADFFIQTLRRFMTRRGPVREITLDNG